jgi:Tol biopolymer transport system component
VALSLRLTYLVGDSPIGQPAKFATSRLEVLRAGKRKVLLARGGENPDINKQGNLIVFERYPGYIWVVKPDGSGLRPISPTRGLGWYEPKFFPDGRHVIVAHSVSQNDNEYFSIDVNTGHYQQLTDDPADPFKWRPFVDVSGTRLYATYGTDAAFDSRMLNSHIGWAQLGGGRITSFHALTPVDHKMPTFDPEVSDDGSHLLYDGGGRIWLAAADGGTAQAIVVGNYARFDRVAPGRILYLHDVSGGDTHRQIWSATIAGGDLHLVCDVNNTSSFADALT